MMLWVSGRPEWVKAQAGHRSIVQTEHYTQFVTSLGTSIQRLPKTGQRLRLLYRVSGVNLDLDEMAERDRQQVERDQQLLSRFDAVDDALKQTRVLLNERENALRLKDEQIQQLFRLLRDLTPRSQANTQANDPVVDAGES